MDLFRRHRRLRETAKPADERYRYAARSSFEMPSDPEKKNPWAQVAGYAELAIVFPAATVIGWLLGVALDHWLHTSWLYIVGLILGIVAGFIELIRTAMKDTS